VPAAATAAVNERPCPASIWVQVQIVDCGIGIIAKHGPQYEEALPDLSQKDLEHFNKERTMVRGCVDACGCGCGCGCRRVRGN
jgi:hypothetical protein